jgi:hypothetical protein
MELILRLSDCPNTVGGTRVYARTSFCETMANRVTDTPATNAKSPTAHIADMGGGRGPRISIRQSLTVCDGIALS